MKPRCWRVRLSFPLLLKDFTPKSLAEQGKATKSQLWGMGWERDFSSLREMMWLGSQGRDGRTCGSAGWAEGLSMPWFWSGIWGTSVYFGFKQLLNEIHINIPGKRLSISHRPLYSQHRNRLQLLSFPLWQTKTHVSTMLSTSNMVFTYKQTIPVVWKNTSSFSLPKSSNCFFPVLSTSILTLKSYNFIPLIHVHSSWREWCSAGKPATEFLSQWQLLNS